MVNSKYILMALDVKMWMDTVSELVRYWGHWRVRSSFRTGSWLHLPSSATLPLHCSHSHDSWRRSGCGKVVAGVEIPHYGFLRASLIINYSQAFSEKVWRAETTDMWAMQDMFNECCCHGIILLLLLLLLLLFPYIISWSAKKPKSLFGDAPLLKMFLLMCWNILVKNFFHFEASYYGSKHGSHLHLTAPYCTLLHILTFDL